MGPSRLLGLRFLTPPASTETAEPCELARSKPPADLGGGEDVDEATKGLVGRFSRIVPLPRSRSSSSWSPVELSLSSYGTPAVVSSQSYPRTTFFMPRGNLTVKGKNQCQVGCGESPPNTEMRQQQTARWNQAVMISESREMNQTKRT